MEEFLTTGKLFLVIWGACSIIVPLGATWLTGAKGLKYGLILGTVVGLMAANVAVAERPYGILVIIVEAFVIIALGVCWVLGKNTRKIEIDGVGTWEEQGLSCLGPDPATRAITAAGDARIGIIEAQIGLTNAGTHHLTAEARMWAQQTEFERLQLDLPRR